MRPSASTDDFDRGTQRLWLEVDDKRSIHLSDYPPLTGKLDLSPILEAEGVDVDRVQVIAQQGCYYISATGFRWVWQVTPRPGTGGATYRSIDVAGSPTGELRLSRYGPAGRSSVRLDSDHEESWFLSDSPIFVSGTVAKDPQELIEQAQAALDRGEADEATTLCRTARALIESDRYWDPEGSYEDRLLPRLEDRIARARSAMAKLQSLQKQLIESAPSPDSEDAEAALARASTIAERSRADLERIAATLPAGRERGAFLQSPRYAEAVRLADAAILDAAESLPRPMVGLPEGDERVRALKARLESLKRQIVDSSVEHQRLERQLDDRQDRHETLRRALIDFIGADPEAPLSLDRALSYNIREVWRAVHSPESRTSPDLARLLDRVERLRVANAANVATGSKDLVGRIDALRAVVESVATAEPGNSSSGTRGRPPGSR